MINPFAFSRPPRSGSTSAVAAALQRIKDARTSKTLKRRRIAQDHAICDDEQRESADDDDDDGDALIVYDTDDDDDDRSPPIRIAPPTHRKRDVRSDADDDEYDDDFVVNDEDDDGVSDADSDFRRPRGTQTPNRSRRRSTRALQRRRIASECACGYVDGVPRVDAFTRGGADRRPVRVDYEHSTAPRRADIKSTRRRPNVQQTTRRVGRECAVGKRSAN